MAVISSHHVTSHHRCLVTTGWGPPSVRAAARAAWRARRRGSGVRTPRRPEHDLHGRLEVGPPAGVDDQRAGSGPGAHPAGDHLAADPHRADGPAHVGRPLPSARSGRCVTPTVGRSSSAPSWSASPAPRGWSRPRRRRAARPAPSTACARPRRAGVRSVAPASPDVRRVRDPGRHLPVHETAVATDHRCAPWPDRRPRPRGGGGGGAPGKGSTPSSRTGPAPRAARGGETAASRWAPSAPPGPGPQPQAGGPPGPEACEEDRPKCGREGDPAALPGVDQALLQQRVPGR